MASGDTVYELDNMSVGRNELSFRFSDVYPDDDGGYDISLGGSETINTRNYLHTVTINKIRSDGTSPSVPLGAPVLDPSKTYDVIIKEH